MNELMREIALLLMVVLLPGFMLILSLFPKKNLMEGDLDIVFKLLLGMIVSLLIAIGSAIFLSHSGIVTGQTILDSDELLYILLILTLIFAAIAWARGGILSYIASVIAIRSGGTEPKDLLSLATRKRELQAKLSELESYRNVDDFALREEASIRSEKLLRDIDAINEKIDAILSHEPIDDSKKAEKERS